MATVRQAVRRDVFPALGMFIGSGAVAGVLVSVAMTVLMEFSAGRRIVHAALSASLGAILGLFVGLGRGIWHFGTTVNTLGSNTPPHRLWDPWLDSDGDGHEPMPQPIDEVNRDDELPAQSDAAPDSLARSAPVRPRIISWVTGEAVPLDDQIGRIVHTLL